MNTVGSEMVERDSSWCVLYISHSRPYHMAAPFRAYLPCDSGKVFLDEALCALPKNTLVDSRIGKFSTSNKAIPCSTVMINLWLNQNMIAPTRPALPR